MIKPIIIILILTAILAGLGYGVYCLNKGCQDEQENNQAKDDVVDISNDVKIADSENDSNVINVEKGSKFSIDLDSNPTTGYSWDFNTDSEYIEFIDKSFASQSEGQIIGAGGKETFNFNALEVGETEITFFYARPWEKDIEPVEKKVYNVIIK